MKYLHAVVFSIGCQAMLSACSTNVAKNNASSTSMVSNNIIKAGTDTATTKKTAFFDGIVIASTNNSCIDQFNFIRSNNNDAYQRYSSDYAKIGEGYRFLNVNKNIMGKEAKDVYTLQLDVKLDTLCAKVHYTSYQIVKEKMKNLASI